jgi:hypothetical protein
MSSSANRLIWIAGLLAVAGALISLGYGNLNMRDQVVEVEEQLARTQQELVGHTTYTTYLSKGKQSLREQSKFLAASVVREDHWIEHMQRDMVLFRSEGTVILKVATEYSFGFDLSPDKFDIVGTDSGIQIQVGKPMLAASPSVKLLLYEFPSRGLLVNEEQAALELMKRLPDHYAIKGRALAKDEAIKALCEKRLIDFLRDFLAKHPGVKVVPNITVAYHA